MSEANTTEVLDVTPEVFRGGYLIHLLRAVLNYQ